MNSYVKGLSGRKVLVTGHTGFKGSWLCLVLKRLGADVYGFSLPPVTDRDLYISVNLGKHVDSTYGDIRDYSNLKMFLESLKPTLIFHLAAQALVLESYKNPLETISTNIIGTTNLLEAARTCGSVRAVINVTSDKCYQDAEAMRPYTEDAALGGRDPYSCSKACAELITSSWLHSFYADQDISLCSARAGNVIGAGDWSQDRLIPDLFRAIETDTEPQIRHPNAVRPWQHVLEPIFGYITLATRMLGDQNRIHQGAWNFGPDMNNFISVSSLLQRIDRLVEGKLTPKLSNDPIPTAYHESNILTINSEKAKQNLQWRPMLSLEETIEWTVAGYQKQLQRGDLASLVDSQLSTYLARM